MTSPAPRVVILATGGTIAGAAASATDNVGYRAGQVGVEQLIAAVPALSAHRLEAEQVAQVDSSDMGETVWRALVARCEHHLQRADVQGLVITHGTDTLEETAWLLQRMLAPAKPVVLTAAMRPATSLAADGPQNLLDAVTVAQVQGAHGVVACVAGRVLSATDVQKVHSYRTDAFDAPDASPVARVVEGRVTVLRPWPQSDRASWPEGRAWPWVEIVTSHALARRDGIDAWVATGVQGLVVAGTGNGTVHEALRGALVDAEHRGVAIALASRCAAGPVLAGHRAGWRVYPGLNAVKSRVELGLELLGSAPQR
ncbi:MAG: asparaginase [Rubrivivax sp.]|jgi:L-asparaginase|nr:asparaginase [Rubrivivax sp.]